MNLSELATLLSAKIEKSDAVTLNLQVEGQKEVQSIGPIDTAKDGQVTFLIKPEYFKFAATTQALAVITQKIIPDCPRPQLIHPNPYWAFAKASSHFAPRREYSKTISERALISPTAKIGKDVTIFPNAFVGDKAEIGDRVVLYPGAYIGCGVVLGAGTEIRANAVIEDGCIVGTDCLIHAATVIGSDGFGFAPGVDSIAKIPQIGIVRIGNDVEVGPGTTIDRAAMGETKIGTGTKIDSSVHIAHNVHVGEHTMICGGAMIAGSAKVGSWCVLAGGCRINGHIVIGDRITVGGMAGATKSLLEPGEYHGFPIMPAREWRRQVVGLRRIEPIMERLKALELWQKKSDT
jgi:UDP-3-O-[3-hydroxymyristoyl] glucosamine N-acyltransferase